MQPRTALDACEASHGNSQSIYGYLFIALNHSIRGLDYTVGRKEILLRQYRPYHQKLRATIV